MLLTVYRNGDTWTAKREDQQVAVTFHDGRDLAAAALLLNATVRTDDLAVREACHSLSVRLEGDPTMDYDQLGT